MLLNPFTQTPARIAVIGLGYVGLPLAVAFAAAHEVVGFDVKEDRILELRAGEDRTLEVSAEELAAVGSLKLTSDPADLAACNVFIVTVPTPIDAQKRPDLSALLAASLLPTLLATLLTTLTLLPLLPVLALLTLLALLPLLTLARTIPHSLVVRFHAAHEIPRLVHCPAQRILLVRVAKGRGRLLDLLLEAFEVRVDVSQNEITHQASSQ